MEAPRPSPIEILLDPISLASLGIGLDPRAATAVLLGYWIQRPESHSVHHGLGAHAFNDADLPRIDLLFGTLKNPASFDQETGFYPGASGRGSRNAAG